MADWYLLYAVYTLYRMDDKLTGFVWRLWETLHCGAHLSMTEVQYISQSNWCE